MSITGVEYFFDFEGIPEEIKYYRSTTPFDLNNMPEPIDVGIESKRYIDVTAPKGTFYAIFSAVRSGVDYYSQPIMVFVPDSGGEVGEVDGSLSVDVKWDFVLSLLPLDGDYSDKAGRLVWNEPITEIFEGENPFGVGQSMKLSGNIGDGLDSTETTQLKYTSDAGDMTVEFFFKKEDVTETTAMLQFVDVESVSDTGRMSFFSRATDTGNINFSVYSRGSTFLEVSVPKTDNLFSHYAYCKKGNSHKLFIDGVKVKEATGISQVFGSNRMKIFVGSNGKGKELFKGLLSNIRITSGFSRYSENFNPRTEPFPIKGPDNPNFIVVVGDQNATDRGVNFKI